MHKQSPNTYVLGHVVVREAVQAHGEELDDARPDGGLGGHHRGAPRRHALPVPLLHELSKFKLPQCVLLSQQLFQRWGALSGAL